MTSLELTIVLGTTLLGTVAGIIGTFSVLRQRALVGDLLSHAALPGLGLAFLLFGGRHFLGLLSGAFVTGLLAVACLAVLRRWTRTKEDAAIGIILSTFFGAGVVIKSLIQRHSTGDSPAGLDSYIFGQAALLTSSDVWAVGLVSLVAVLLVLLLYKEFKVLSFDPEFARAQGWPTFRLDLLMMGTLAMVTVIGLPAVGVVLMAAMLITPAAAARFWTNRLGTMLLLSGAIGGLSGLLGSLVSAGLVKQWFGFELFAFGNTARALPAGPVIVLCGTALFLFSLLFAPQRGLVGRLLQHYSVRRKFARENLLQILYQQNEATLPQLRPIAASELLTLRKWSPRTLSQALRYARRQGWVTITTAGAILTPVGLTRAAHTVQRQRLWEQLRLSTQAGLDDFEPSTEQLELLLSAQQDIETSKASQTPSAVPASPTVDSDQAEKSDKESQHG